MRSMTNFPITPWDPMKLFFIVHYKPDATE